MGTEKISIDDAAEAAYAELAGNDTEEEVSTPQPAIDSEEQVSSEEPGEAPASEAQQSAAPSYDPPPFWSQEDKARFAKLDREGQEAVLRYEQMRNKYISKLESEKNKSQGWDSRIQKIYTPERVRKLALNNMKVDEVLDNQLQWQEYFLEDKASAAVDFLHSQKLTNEEKQWVVRAYLGMQQPEQQNGGGLTQEDVDRLVQERFNSFLETQKAQQQQARINAFAQEFLESKGPRAKLLEPQIAQAVQQLKQQYPYAEPGQLLETAYEWVIRQFGADAQQGAVQRAQAAKGASVSLISGEPGTNGGSNGRPKLKGSRDQKIEQAIALAERASAR